MKLLKDICNAQSSNIALKDLISDSGSHPIYGASGLITNVDFYKIDKPYVGVVKDGAGVGRIMLLPAKSSVIGTMQCIIPAEGIDVKYLSYLLDFLDLGRFCSGATIPHIYFKDYGKEPIPEHSPEQQKKISAILDRIKDLTNLRQQQLIALDQLAKSRFIEMFGDPATNPRQWTLARFDEFALIDAQMTTEYEKYADYPHIGIDSIEKTTGNLVGFRTVKEDNVISGKYLFSEKHIIYSKIRPNLNKIALPNFSGVCSADAYPILPKENCSRVFLAFVMRSDYFLKYILPLSGRSNMPKVNREQLRGFSMPLPPLELQNEFAAFVEQLDKSKVIGEKQGFMLEKITCYDIL